MFYISIVEMTMDDTKIKIIHETADQIIKDFAIFGIAIEFSGDCEKVYSELKFQLEDQIDKLIGSNFEKLMSVLYRIDVSEKQIAEVTAGQSPARYSNVISDKIIERELQKVLTRIYYQTKSNEQINSMIREFLSS